MKVTLRAMRLSETFIYDTFLFSVVCVSLILMYILHPVRAGLAHSIAFLFG